MRIAIVTEVFLPKIDGVVNRTLNLIKHLSERGDEVLVVCPEADVQIDCSVPVVAFRSFPFPSYPEYRIGLPDARLADAIRSFAPDIVHYVNPFAFGFRCYDLLERLVPDLPSVFSFHTLYGEFVRRYGLLRPLGGVLWWLMREYHNCASSNLTVSPPMREELERRGFERVGCWPPAVDSELFHPEQRNVELRSRLSNGRPDRPLLLTVSRLAPEKNVEFLADLMARMPDAGLAVVGDGPQRAALERRFAGLNTTFVGYLRGRELAQAYASSDLFVYASETETMGNVVLEAMAAGRAVVAPAAGGIPSLIRQGETGMLFAPGDLDAAAGHVRRLLDDPGERGRIEAAARRDVEGRSWRASIGGVRECYEQTIASHAATRPAKPRRRRLASAVVSSLVFAFRSVAAGAPRRHARRRPTPTG